MIFKKSLKMEFKKKVFTKVCSTEFIFLNKKKICDFESIILAFLDKL